MSVPQRDRVSTTPSILKKSKSLKSRLSEITQTPAKVKFVLPHTKRVRTILQEYVKTKSSKEYENILCLIRDAELTDDDVSSLLKEATECISILNNDLRLFIEALLSIDWVGKNSNVVSEYQSFIVNLLSAHNYHAKMVIEKLVKLFLPVSDEEWPEGTPTEMDCLRCINVHVLLNLLLAVVPLCKKMVMNSISYNFPYYNKSAHIHEYYIHNIMWILDYQPSFRPDILHLVFSKLVIMDVNAPKEEIEKCVDADNEIFEMDDARSVRTSTTAFTKVNRHSLAHTLDICLDKIYNYFISECHDANSGEIDWEKTKTLYHDMINIFDTVILPTYNCHHVQFIMFLMGCFKPSLTEAFLNFLWKKVCNPNVAPIIRQAAVNYIASLVSRANYIPLTMLKGTLQQMAEWIHSYISTQDGLESINSDIRIHLVFYSVCQALFYIVSFRHKDLVQSKKNIVFLESLNMARMVTSRLNPLKVCQTAVVQNFAAITRKYQLAYCYSIIEHNTRNKLPIIYQDDQGIITFSDNVLNSFYPFDPYILERSANKIQPFYRDYQETVEESLDRRSMDVEMKETNEVDDFLCNQDLSTTPTNKLNQFSYSSSPGFKHKT